MGLLGTITALHAALFGCLVVFVFNTSPVYIGKVFPRHQFPSPNRESITKNDLADSKQLFKGSLSMETVFYNGDQLIGIREDGAILYINTEKEEMTEWMRVGGRPLGGDVDAEGNLILADPLRGLLKIHKQSGMIEILTNSISTDKLYSQMTVEEQRHSIIHYADDLVIAKLNTEDNEGRIYFSDATNITAVVDVQGYIDVFLSSVYDAFTGIPSGRLLEYNPKTKQTRVLMDKLYFANGVTLSADETFVLICETMSRRVMRYYIAGPNKGKKDIFADGLPAIPDGITTDKDGNFWVALVGTIPPLMYVVDLFPSIEYFLRKFSAGLPKQLFPDTAPYAGCLKLDPEGNFLKIFAEPTGKVLNKITSVAVDPKSDKVYFGSLKNDFIAQYPLGENP